jgi:histidine triad (HIT) family protein
MECLFCNIANKKIPAKIVAENEYAIAFLDVKPLADGHTIVIPKKHYANLSSCSKIELHAVIELVHDVANILIDSKLKP